MKWKNEAAEAKSWYCSIVPDCYISILYSMAVKTSGLKSLRDQDVLTVFFTDDAVELLLQCPNLFWFWKVFGNSVTEQRDKSARIEMDAVERAIAIERMNLAKWWNGKNSLELVSRENLALYVAEGVVLVDYNIGTNRASHQSFCSRRLKCKPEEKYEFKTACKSNQERL